MVRERTRAGVVIGASLLLGFLIGIATELLTPWLEGFLGFSAVVIFGLGIGVVEGPTLISAIVLSRRVTRPWVRSALQAAAPFLGFAAYLVAYGLVRHPPFAFPFAIPSWAQALGALPAGAWEGRSLALGPATRSQSRRRLDAP